MRGRQDFIGCLKRFGEQFAGQAALPSGIGVRRIETHAIAQARLGTAFQQQAAAWQCGKFALDLRGGVQQHAVAAHEVRKADVCIGQRGTHQVQRGFHHAETRPTDVDALRNQARIWRQGRQRADIRLGIVVQQQADFGVALGQPQPI